MRFQIKPVVLKCRKAFEIEFNKLDLRPCTVVEAMSCLSEDIYAVIEESVYRLFCLPGNYIFVNVATMNRKDEGNPDLRIYLSQYTDYLYFSNY